MWTIWKEELYKIASRKIIWLGIILLLAFLSFRLFAEQDSYSVTIDGTTYRGREAIRADQALTRRYAGILTQEKIQKIYKEFGFYSYDWDTHTALGNFCSKFITEEFTNYRQTDGNDPKKVHFYEGEEYACNTLPYLEHQVWFDYIYGWDDFAEINMVVMLALSVILIIGLSPVFAEEYQLNTADILRTTRRGRQSGIWIKILAAFFFTVTVTCGVNVYIWGIYLAVFGTQGLTASSALLNFVSFFGYHPDSILGYLLLVTFLGFMGVLLLTGLEAGISALCRNPFLALVISLAVFLFPVLWVKVLAPMWILGPDLTKSVTHFMVSMPAYLPMNMGFAFSIKQLLIHLGIALIVGCGSVCLGYHRYRLCIL